MLLPNLLPGDERAGGYHRRVQPAGGGEQHDHEQHERTGDGLAFHGRVTPLQIGSQCTIRLDR